MGADVHMIKAKALLLLLALLALQASAQRTAAPGASIPSNPQPAGGGISSSSTTIRIPARTRPTISSTARQPPVITATVPAVQAPAPGSAGGGSAGSGSAGSGSAGGGSAGGGSAGVPFTTRKPLQPVSPGQASRSATTARPTRGRKINRKFGTANQCEMLGFLGAEQNQCGYCVGGLTELPADYGLDCAGQCGRLYVDCAGQCGGTAYVDECSGLCIASSEVDVFQPDVVVVPLPEGGTGGATNTTNETQSGREQPQKYQQKEKETPQIVLPRRAETGYPEATGRIITRQLENAGGAGVPGGYNTNSAGVRQTAAAGGPAPGGLFGGTSGTGVLATARPTLGPQPRDCRGLCELDRRPANNFTFVTDVCGICVIQYESLPNRTQSPSALANRTQSTAGTRLNATVIAANLNATATNAANTANAANAVNAANLANSGAGLPTSGTGTAGQRLPSNQQTGIPGISTARSRYKDCSGVCFAPGGKHNMAVNTSDTCWQCVGPQTRFPLSEFKDQCGRCKKDNIPCPCPISQQDICGVCGGKNDTCTSVVRVVPSAVPGGNKTTVEVTGVALKTKYHVVCLLIRKDIQADGKDEEKFPAAIRSTGTTCEINAPEGSYRFHLAILQENGDVLSLSNNSVPFVVYNNQAAFLRMSPSSLTVPEGGTDHFTVRFAATNLQRIRTIVCQMEGPAWPLPVRVLSEMVSANEASCRLPFPRRSTVANVSVSIDGRRIAAGPFPLKFFAPMPFATDAYLLQEGNDVVVFFDRDINVTAQRTCEDILQSPITSLGDGALCRWVTKNQLVLSLGDPQTVVRPRANDSNKEISVRFKDDVLFSANETYAEGTKNLTLSFSLVDEVPVVVLVAPRVVPSCGTFVLDGHQSVRTQSRRVRYRWDVTSSNPNAINQSLIDFLDEQTQNNSASFTLNVLSLLVDTDYTFTLTVSNGALLESYGNRSSSRARTNRTLATRAPLTEPLTPTSTRNSNASSSDRNRSASASVTVYREMHNVPIVMIEPSIANYPGAVTLEKRFTLTAHLTMPACQHEIFSITYKWTVDNPRVKFDMAQMNRKIYTVQPYTLPPGENVTFEVEATLNNDVNLTSRALISFNVTQLMVRAILQGGYQRTAANDSGLLRINMSRSHHVDTPRMPLVYRWECFEEDNNPCYNYHPNANDTLLLPQPVTRDPVLLIRTNHLRPGSLLNLYVRAFSPLNSSEISDTRNVAIRVFNGSAPLVSIDSVQVQDSNVHKPDMEDIIHLVPSMTDIVVTASVEHNVPLANVSWSIPGFFYDLQPYAMSQTVNKTTQATLVLRKEHLTPNGVYKVNATATNVLGESGWALAAFTVLSPVTRCRVIVDDYEAFAMVEVRVESCASSQHNHPLSYQAFVQDRINFISLSAPTAHLPLAIMGPPAYLGENTTTPQNIFSVQVCDTLGSCWWFNSTAVRVKAVADFQMAGEHAFYMANIAKLQENYLGCLRRHALYLKAMAPRYRSKHEVEFESQLAESFLCARRAADDQCTDSDCFANLFNFISYLPVETNPGRDFMLIEVMQKAIDRLQKRNVSLSEYGAQQAYLVLEKIYRYNDTNLEVSRLVRRMGNQIQTVLARSLQPDQSGQVVDSTGHTAFAQKYAVLNDTFTVNVGPEPANNHTATLQFSKDLRKKFRTWKCEKNSTRLCRGVVAQMQFFPEYLYRPMQVEPNKTVSEIVAVALFNPLTGERMMNGNGEKAKTTLTLTVDANRLWSNLSYDCYAWDDTAGQWITDDVDTDVTNNTIFSCTSKYLATLAVIGSVPSLSAGIIAAIVVGVLLVVVGIALAAFFIYKKARTKTMRVSISKGYQPNVQ